MDGKKRLVKAVYSYTPVNIDELELKVNDILEVIEETEEGWWKGILGGIVGMFPSNFVVELDKLPEELNNQLANELSPTKNLNKIKNVNQQEPVNKINSSVNSKGDSKSNPDTRGDEVSNNSSLSKPLVQETNDKSVISVNRKPQTSIDSVAPRLPPKPVKEQAKVMYPYTALNDDELTLKEGDIITVISKEIEDKGWWKGELSGRIGVFPDNFVQLMKAEEQKKPERPDKPPIASKASSKAEKKSSEASPKIEKKIPKTPPAKPPPPEILKKEPEKPTAICPSKKPQLPPPVKKPLRPSISTKLPGFPPPASLQSPKSPVSESSPLHTVTADSANVEKKSEVEEKVVETSAQHIKEEIHNKDETGFDAVFSTADKLIHLTAKRARAPNRRPPSQLFFKESEKETTVVDSRRLSEPLLAEMKALFPPKESEPVKVNVLPTIEIKRKVPPSRPSPPSHRRPILNHGPPEVPAKSFSTSDITSTKTTEPTSTLDESDFVIVDSESGSNSDLATNSLTVQTMKTELANMKFLMNTMVKRTEYDELLAQVRQLKEQFQDYKEECNLAISDLKAQLHEERSESKRLREKNPS